jgi:DNA-directed RNA polymerase subunit M/transcription elongation factor TFIIS
MPHPPTARPATAATASGSAAAAVPTQRSRRGRAAVAAAPLGSLTQVPSGAEDGCAACGSEQVTRLAMRLTDGTPVRFVSCHRCEHRRWEHEGAPLSVETVVERTRKPA